MICHQKSKFPECRTNAAYIQLGAEVGYGRSEKRFGEYFSEISQVKDQRPICPRQYLNFIVRPYDIQYKGLFGTRHILLGVGMILGLWRLMFLHRAVSPVTGYEGCLCGPPLGTGILYAYGDRKRKDKNTYYHTNILTIFMNKI